LRLLVEEVQKEAKNQDRRLEELERKAAARRQARLIREEAHNGSDTGGPMNTVSKGTSLDAPKELVAGKTEPVEKANGQEADQKDDPNVVQEAAKRANCAWFVKGGTRINRKGRGLKPVPTLVERVKTWDGQRACPVCGREPTPKSGRLMRLTVSEKELRGRLAAVTFDCAYLLTLPDDARIVVVDLDPVRGAIFTYHSEEFKPVHAEEPIPELCRHVQGLKRPRSW